MNDDSTIDEADPQQRVRLDVSYDGSDFAGWARQPGQRTVHGLLEDALVTVLRLPAVTLTVAGRTDAGVHAVGQVIHTDLPASLWAAQSGLLVRRLNGVLPPDVRVRGARAVPSEFDARFAATWRRYEYRIVDKPSQVDPRRRGFELTWPRELDLAAMAAAAGRLTGLHDFAAFCRRREGATTIRTLLRLDVVRDSGAIVLTVEADAFCHSMVRSLVGALIAVGERRRGVEWPASLLAGSERSSDVHVAPAHGLTLLEVGYPPDDELAARAEKTRARRT